LMESVILSEPDSKCLKSFCKSWKTFFIPLTSALNLALNSRIVAMCQPPSRLILHPLHQLKVPVIDFGRTFVVLRLDRLDKLSFGLFKFRVFFAERRLCKCR